MDWRWLLLSLVAAGIAAVRLRRHPPERADDPASSASFPSAPTATTTTAAASTTTDGPVTSSASGQPARPEPGAPTGPEQASPTETEPDRRPDPQPDIRQDLRSDRQRSRPPTPGPDPDRALDRSLDASLDATLDARGSAERSDLSAPNDRSDGTADSRRHDSSAWTDHDPDGPGGAIGHAGVEAALARVWAEHVGEADTLLESRLRLLVHRGVPARAIRPAPGTRTVRVVFADGTVLLCRGSGQGDFGRLGLAMLHHSVRLGSFRRTADGTRLEFRWHPDQSLAALAVGLDQPD